MKTAAPPARRDNSQYLVQSVDRAISLLDAFRHGGEHVGVTELAERVDLHRATVHRLLASLEHCGLVEQDRQTGKYRLGFKLFELGSMVADAFDVKKMAYPHMINLADKGGETAHLVVLDGSDIVFIEKVESSNPFRMVSQVGKRLPAHCSAAGKALLAGLPPEELGRHLGLLLPPLTDKSFTSADQLKEHLDIVRRQGYATDDEETQIGLRCVGTVVRDRTGKAVAALSVSGPVARVSRKRIPEIARLVIDAAGSISMELGYRGNRGV